MRVKNPCFRFKQFRVFHDRCAMKVGTDGVLLGAWAPLDGASRILDVGTGSGVIALMAAQRNVVARIDGVEIDAEACRQAASNFAASPWCDRLRAVHASFSDYTLGDELRYDHIVSNPPYFEETLLPPDPGRSVARHTLRFSFDSFFREAFRLLEPGGRLSLIYPASDRERLESLAVQAGFRLDRVTVVRGRAGAPPKRLLACWSRPFAEADISSLQADELAIEEVPGHFTEAYRMLTRDFYLAF